ncbi:MAG: bifunctional sugar-1-phosphate nucleotidylyltransferase/acetyltransferase [Candidatus Hodarchaeota archaeon]
MKGVILAAGEGKRLHPLTLTRPKQTLPVAGDPLLEVILNGFKEAGIRKALLIVGHFKEKIIELFGDGEALGLKLEYVAQPEVLGTANAIGLAEDFADGENFVVTNGDVLTSPYNYSKVIEYHAKKKSEATIGLARVEDPSLYGVVEFDNKQRITSITEKPKPDDVKSKLASSGIMVLSSDIFDVIKRTPQSRRNEYEITDSIQIMIKENKSVYGCLLSDFWIDIGRPWDLLKANKILLNERDLKVEGKVESGAVLIGSVGVKLGAIVRSGSYIEGPSLVDEEADIGPNCYIRPSTYVGKKCRIGNACELKNSIILDRTHIAHLSYVGDSIIGENANFGAGTITANLRLDEKTIPFTLKGVRVDSGRRKLGVIMGDGVKTGIGVMIMPGLKIGPNSMIDPNLTVWEDVPPNEHLRSQKVSKDWKSR